MDFVFGNKLHEECGVFGVFSKDNSSVAADSYLALYALQHRGQESCGIAINDGGLISGYKDLGLVNEVFTQEVMDGLSSGDIAIGHCRYATTGNKSRVNAQPLIIRHIKGTMALAHNGNLINASVLREELELSGAIFHTTSDTEVISYIMTRERLNSSSTEEALSRTMEKIEGAYSLVVMSPRKLIAARDPRGFRPLCIGKRGESYFVASESCALDAVDAQLVRELEPGEIVVINNDGLHSIKTHCGKKKSSFCVFEYIYFARPDSVINGSGVHNARQRAGAYLALEHPVQADVVIGVPDSGLDAAQGYSKQSGIPYGTGFIKNKYIGRTFIQPSQRERENSVRIKLNPIASTVHGKRVVLIDDSIVRGTTSARIVNLLKEAGATEVHMRVSSPKFLYPCYFGTDIDSRENLIAVGHSTEEIAKMIGVDSLGFLNVSYLENLQENSCKGICKGCFTGEYPMEIPLSPKKSKFECKISNKS